MNLGVILEQTFRVYFANFLAFVMIVGLLLSPVFILQAYGFATATGDPEEIPWSDLVAMLLSMFLTPVATGALTYGVFQQVRGRHATVADCLGTGLRRLFPVLGVSILSGLITMVGMLLCIVPGLIATAVLAAAVPAAVIERPGVIGALARSADLTKGHRWTVFGALFLIGLMGLVVGGVLGIAVMFVPTVFLIFNMITTTVFTGLSATAAALIYYHLRRVKESIDVDEIAAVFD